MKPIGFLLMAAGLTTAMVTVAQGAAKMSNSAKIQNAMSAAPSSISKNATILDWPSKEGEQMPTLRQGKNGWTCLPDMPDTPGNDPMCLDEPWMMWADAWMHKKPLTNAKMGFGYMLQQNTAESNTDPYAKGPAADNEWMEKGVPHLMVLVPDDKNLQGLPTDPHQGGPWVMWRNTPYVHVMAPMPLNK